jgi:branched-subunit amino acid aminotransferase/4-amino-4-deoxychorismate lyase
MIGSDDRGFTLGDGLFETVLAQGGRLRHLDQHLDRLAAGCAIIGLPAPDRAQAERLMGEALAPLGVARAAVRLTLTAGAGGRGLDRPADLNPVLVATAALAPRPQTPAALMTANVRRNDRSPASRLKTLSYLDAVFARAEARQAGVDEALMLNTAGEVACAAAANLLWVAAGELFTPALECGVLAGTKRARVLAAASVREVRVARDALDGAEAIFLSNSLIGLRAVTSLDGRDLAPWSGLADLDAASEEPAP